MVSREKMGNNFLEVTEQELAGKSEENSVLLPEYIIVEPQPVLKKSWGEVQREIHSRRLT